MVIALMIFTFVLGYVFITLEHLTKVNKTSVALLMAIVCWALQFINHATSHESNLANFQEHLANVSQVILFLLCALAIVEIINAHRGFYLISRSIRVRSTRQLLWVIGGITFFLSAVLDNLTTTIVMIVLLRKLMEPSEDRLLVGGAVVIAANAGGAWSPIGDVTTTMLWIGGQLSTFPVMRFLLLPSLICCIASLACLTPYLKGKIQVIEEKNDEPPCEPMGNQVFWIGLVCLIFVPLFKALTGLPPFMGMIFGLALMWLFTDLVHRQYLDRAHLRVPRIMTKIDISGVLFFLGILLCIDALHTAGILHTLAEWMDREIGNPDFIAIAIGLFSAVIDNVPLVAAAMGMYDLHQYPSDSSFWNLVAYCAGTGGSILVIGSAAGVAFMGLEQVQFFWYMRRLGFVALVGYVVGIIVFQLTI